MDKARVAKDPSVLLLNLVISVSLIDQICIQLPWIIPYVGSWSVDHVLVNGGGETLDADEQDGGLPHKKEFQEKVKADIDQNQKEYILREQMKVIRKELGGTNACPTQRSTRKSAAS